ncbi:MAG: peptide-methionine (R)-S-oxide reductase, partial [Leeuwenhoekiella sp.]
MNILNKNQIFLGFAVFLGLAQVSCQDNPSKGSAPLTEGDRVAVMNKKFTEAQDDEVWKEKLNDDEYEIMVEKGTEPPFKNSYYDNHKKGIYVSATTGEPLFSSEDKFDSGTGWPAFSKPLKDNAVLWVKDNSLGMSRDEVVE